MGNVVIISQTVSQQRRKRYVFSLFLNTDIDQADVNVAWHVGYFTPLLQQQERHDLRPFTDICAVVIVYLCSLECILLIFSVQHSSDFEPNVLIFGQSVKQKAWVVQLKKHSLENPLVRFTLQLHWLDFLWICEWVRVSKSITQRIKNNKSLCAAVTPNRNVFKSRSNCQNVGQFFNVGLSQCSRKTSVVSVPPPKNFCLRAGYQFMSTTNLWTISLC